MRIILAVSLWALLISAIESTGQAPTGCDGTEQTRTVSVAMGEGDSIAQLRERGIAQAKRETIEACGGWVDSQTQVQDGAVLADSVTFAAQGQITSLRVIEGHIVPPIVEQASQTSYTYQLTAKIVAARMAGNEDPGFRVTSVRMDKQAYGTGESARITIRLNQAAYLYVFNVASDHSISLLFPTSLDKAGANYVMPPEFIYPSDQHLMEGRKLRLAYDPNVGSDHVTEYMEVLATKTPLDLSSSGIAEAINKPRSVGDTAASTALAKVLVKMKRDNVAFGVADYELYRSITPQH